MLNTQPKRRSLISRILNPKYIMVYSTVAVFLVIYLVGAIAYGDKGFTTLRTFLLLFTDNAYIGISADFSHFQLSGLIFAVVFVLIGILGKIIGCGGVARAFHYTGRESLTIGCGMIARGEVALAVYATGQSLIYYENGVLAGIDPLVATIFLIVCSSILCPILLKLVFKNQSQPPMTGSARKVSISSEAIDDNMGDDNVKNASRSAGKKAVTATSVCAIQNPS